MFPKAHDIEKVEKPKKALFYNQTMNKNDNESDSDKNGII